MLYVQLETREMLMSKIFKLYQIVIDKQLSDLINSEGWDCHIDALSYRNASEGDPSFGIINDCYTHVADLVCDDLDHCFEVGNGYGSADRFVKKTGVNRTSVSVGDLIEDEDGLLHLVDSIGFRNVTHLKTTPHMHSKTQVVA